MSFETREWETEFTQSLYRKFQAQEFCNFLTKALLDVLVLELFIYTRSGAEPYHYLIGTSLLLIVEVAVLISVYKLGETYINGLIGLFYASFCVTGLLYAAIGPTLASNYGRGVQLQTMILYVICALNCRIWSFRAFMVVLVAMMAIQLGTNYYYLKKYEFGVQNYIAESVLNLVLAVLFALIKYSSEMHARKTYNASRIVSMETLTTE